MRQEDSQEQSPTQPAHSSEVGTPPRARKLFFVFLGIGLVVLVIAAGPYIMKVARAEFGRNTESAGAPPPASPPKISLPAAPAPTLAPPPQQPSLSADELAQKLWGEFEKSAWGAPLQEWSSQHPDISCKAFHGNMWAGGADRQWSHRCSSGPRLEAAHWSFYVFSLQEPLVPRLEQFDVSTPALPDETLSSVRNSLLGNLAGRFGPGEDASFKTVTNRSVSWPPRMRWQAGDVEILLFLSEFDPQRKQGRLQLQARHQPLLEALKDDERLRLVGSVSFWHEEGTGIDKQLADNLRPDFPEAATFLVKNQPDPDPEKVREAFQKAQSQIKASPVPGQTGPRAAIVAVGPLPSAYWKAQDFHDALVKLLKSVKTAPRERQPVLLVAADRMAARLPNVTFNDKSREGDWSEWRDELARLGVTYASTYEESWAYTGSLLRRVWNEYGDTDWGERAFLVLLIEGWDLSVDCAAGTDSFRKVIPRGLEFLGKHPNSPYRLDVQLAVAQAYETWWSLSQAPTGEGEELAELDVNVPVANYVEGADAARQKAIALYEQFLQEAPQSDYAAYASRVLPRLKLGIDTGQWRYFCFFSD